MADTFLQEMWSSVLDSVFTNGNYYQQAKEENKLVNPEVVDFVYKVWCSPIDSFAKD